MFLINSWKLYQNLYNAADTESGGEFTADTILESLNKSAEERDDEDKDEESSDEDETVENKPEEKEEIDELKELEEELKEPTDEDLELKTPVQRRALLKDYPDVFKKHPGLESTIYRERAYTELLPTIADAKEALASLQTLENFEKDLNSGNTVKILEAVKADDPKAFAKLADNYLENLAQVDERAFHHVLGNVTKDIVEQMLKFGKDNEDEEIQSAAAILYKFMFNDTKWKPKQKMFIDDVTTSNANVERQKLDKEKADWENSKISEQTTKLLTSVDNQIKGTIEKSIDPKNQMTEFVKAKAVEEVLSKASNLLKSDTRFQAIVKQLTDKAKKEGFSEISLKRISSAHFSKYNTVLLPIIQSVRKIALKGNTAKIKDKEETNDTTERANRDKPQSRNNSGNKQDLSKPLPGESSLDFLMRRKK